ncbi:MAG: hypothetical protein Unbinned5081contig1003_44 [Prokaryotic dsDNA virus sp.]|nr:MAG: hypothetical protein Unbinned5081contig1003_44 [Prokaryotic dsDNA virus sp.]|tara:strand:- start:27204 stop:27452 length:249 start_codon:yes stop_codon:yes gene_type:complete
MEKNEESMTQQHLRVVNQIAEILEKEFDDSDDIYFVIRTLRNIFLWESEDSHTQHLFNRALERFAECQPVFLENLIKTKKRG